MSDWADEKAASLDLDGDWYDSQHNAVAAALRAARNEALEEAVEAVRTCFIVPIPSVQMALYNNGVGCAEAAIRALKDKQP